MKLKIITVPDPRLTQKSKPVKKITGSTKQLIKAMSKLIDSEKNGQRIGVGLSAVQAGKPIRLFIAYDPKTQEKLVIINPKITWKSKKILHGLPDRENKFEGCLSLPGIFGLVKRHASLKLRWQDLQGQVHEQKFKDFISVIIQHEIDHLDGILFTQRVLKQGGDLFRLEKDKQGKERLAAINVN